LFFGFLFFGLLLLRLLYFGLLFFRFLLFRFLVGRVGLHRRLRVLLPGAQVGGRDQAAALGGRRDALDRRPGVGGLLWLHLIATSDGLTARRGVAEVVGDDVAEDAEHDESGESAHEVAHWKRRRRGEDGTFRRRGVEADLRQVGAVGRRLAEVGEDGQVRL